MVVGVGATRGKVASFLLVYPEATYSEIGQALGISKQRVAQIATGQLGVVRKRGGRKKVREFLICPTCGNRFEDKRTTYCSRRCGHRRRLFCRARLHPMVGKNVYRYINTEGMLHRRCRECSRAYYRVYIRKVRSDRRANPVSEVL